MMTDHATIKQRITDSGWSLCDSPAVGDLHDCYVSYRGQLTLTHLNAAAEATGFLKNRCHRSISGDKRAPLAGFVFNAGGGGTIAVDFPEFDGGRLKEDVTVYTMGNVGERDEIQKKGAEEGGLENELAKIIDRLIEEIDIGFTR